MQNLVFRVLNLKNSTQKVNFNKNPAKTHPAFGRIPICCSSDSDACNSKGQ